MREILFRGKRIDNDEWIYWNKYGRLTDINGEPIKIEARTSIFHPYAFYINDLPTIREETVGEYTGLTDKNGKRIFEGDIVRNNKYGEDNDSYDYYSTIFSNGSFRAQYLSNLYYTPKIYDIYFEGYEIIGNMHDNPELLEETK